MMISTKGRYALRVMIDIAQNGSDAPVSLHDVAKRQQISIKYLEAIISMLVKAGFVDSFRGKTGGYLLKKAPEKTTVREIIEVTEGTTAPVACTGENCPRHGECMTAPLWNELEKMIGDYLENITLKNVIDGDINRNI